MRAFLLYTVLLATVILSGWTVASPLAHNILFVLANQSYTLPRYAPDQADSIGYWLEQVGDCSTHADRVGGIEALVLDFDACYTNHTLALHSVAQSFSLAGDDLAQGSSRPGESTGRIVTLFGAGYVQVRLFLVSETTEMWQIAVRAKHDAPAPVVFKVWLGADYLGELVFDKGDDSWETLALNTPIQPGFYNLYIWYVNDLFDPELGLDRNAYIESIQVMR